MFRRHPAVLLRGRCGASPVPKSGPLRGTLRAAAR